jgi:DNA-binding MarR family transcriptional regulator
MNLDVQNPSIVRSLVIAVFALNGRLVETGNQLVGGAGLTTAWWQVLGAIGYSLAPLPVAHIARNMGLSRQSVQRVVDLLAERDMVEYKVNPHHQRAKLVVLTPAGRVALDTAEALEAPLNQAVLKEIGGGRIAIALEVLTEMNTLMTRSNFTTNGDKGESGPT